MSKAPRLFCLDTVLIDVVLKIDALPKRAGDVLANETLVTTGGGFNAMSGAARHDMKVIYASRLGTGPFADVANSALENEGIKAPIERSSAHDVGICIVLLEPDGERSFVTSPGAEATLRLDDLATLGVSEVDYVLVSGYNVMYEGQAEIVLSWLEQLPSGTIIVFDPATRMVDIPKSNLDSMMALSSWLVCNASEATALSASGDITHGAAMLASSQPNLNVLVRNGSSGCVVVAHDADPVAVKGFETTVVDTNGAGDVHNGVFIAEMASGHDPIDAASWANAAAAMSIAKLGPASCPTRPEVAAFITAR